MSLAVVHSRALQGIVAPPVAVEVHLANGLPAFAVVGLADAEVREARDRVRAAIQTARFDFPNRRLTVNLAPADLPKESGRFDLPIALGVLAAGGQLPADRLADYEFAGELALTGELRPVRGALAIALAAGRAGRKLILPRESALEAALLGEVEVYGATDLAEVCAHLSGGRALVRSEASIEQGEAAYPDLSEVKGQSAAKRALEVAAAGAHSLLLVGPPGSGKSMLASRLPGLLPPLDRQAALETAALQSLGSQGFDPARFGQRPFRQPHHTASAAALVGGGSEPRPGEISLSHHGVLFLDELPEFDRRVLEVLREPLENHRIVISRAARQAEFPASFQLVAAMNPCPCGYRGHPGNRCRCSPVQVSRYQNRLSGPLLDRIDLTVEVPAIPHTELSAPAAGESSATVRRRVAVARERQSRRQGKENALLGARELDRFAAPDRDGARLLEAAMQRLDLSARAYHRILRVARTVADLAGSDAVASVHLAEAIGYRRGL